MGSETQGETMQFADLKYCRVRNDRKAKFCVRHGPFKIEKYFETEAEGIEFQAQLVISLNLLKRILPHLTAQNYDSRLSQADYDILLSQPETLLPEIDSRISFVPTALADISELLRD